MDVSNQKQKKSKQSILKVRKRKMKEKSKKPINWKNILGTDKTASVLLDRIPKNVLKKHEDKLKVALASGNHLKNQVFKAAKKKPLLKEILNSSLVLYSKPTIHKKKKKTHSVNYSVNNRINVNYTSVKDGLLQWQVRELDDNSNKPSAQDLNIISKKKRKLVHSTKKSKSPKKSSEDIKKYSNIILSQQSSGSLIVDCRVPKVLLTDIFQNIDEESQIQSPMNLSMFSRQKPESCEIIEPQQINVLPNKNNDIKSNKIKKKKVQKSCTIEVDNTEEISENSETLEEIIENSEIDRVVSIDENETSDNNDLVIHDDHLESRKVIKHTSSTYEYYIVGTTCFIILRHPSKLYFKGKLRVSAIFGKVEILGHILDTNTDVVYSLTGSSLLCFETLENTASVQSKHVLSDYGLNENLIQSLQDSDCILKLHRHDSVAVSFINEHMNNILNVDCNCSLEVEKLLKCRFYQNSYEKNMYEKNHAWDQIIDNVSLTSVGYMRNIILLSGGKNVGKSTLMRYLTNKLVPKTESVLCIDLDPGQAEFTIGGCVSATLVSLPLLGPSYTHLSTPIKSIFLGTVDVSECTTRYFKAIDVLIQFCNKDEKLKKVPWIVNTMGFIRGLGLDIITAIIGLIKPTQVVQIISGSPKQNFPHILRPHYVKEVIAKNSLFQTTVSNLNYEITVLDTVVATNFGDIQSKNARQFNVFSYFSQLLKHEGDTLNAINPYKVKKGAINIVSLSSKVADEYQLALINANMVALCSKGNNEDANEVYIIHGFGIVRGIDNDDIYILTPMKPNELDAIKYLILSSEKLPESLYLKNMNSEVPIPYFSTAQTSRTTTIPKRSYINYKSVLKNLIK